MTTPRDPKDGTTERLDLAREEPMTDPVSPELKEEQMASSASLPAHVADATETDTPCDLEWVQEYPDETSSAIAKTAIGPYMVEWLHGRGYDGWGAHGPIYSKLKSYAEGQVYATRDEAKAACERDAAVRAASVFAALNRRADTASGGRGEGASCTESGGTASPKSDGLCKSEGDH